MRILLVNIQIHQKNCHAILNYKNIEVVSIYNLNQINNINLTDFDCVFSPSIPIDVSKYPNTKFIFGPHFSVFPNKEQLQLINKPNSIYIMPSQWPINFWIIHNVNNRMLSLPFGVDTNRFNQINSNEQRNKVFIYHKRRKPEELNTVISLLDKYNISYELFDYVRRYNENHYINYLQQSIYGIWVDAHESQGFALQEALACNVPLLVWNITTMSQEYGSSYKDIPATTIPYWDDRCGEVFYNVNELETTFKLFLSRLDHYKPRDFIVENLSFEKCEDNLIEIIHKINI
jgi:hypothetical protein